MDEINRFPSAGEFYSAERDADAGSPLINSLNERFCPNADISPYTEEKSNRPAVFSSLSANSCPEESLLSALENDSYDNSDIDNSTTNGSTLSSDSRKIIEPDIVSINKMLNFDSGDESSDDIADEILNDTDKDKLIAKDDVTFGGLNMNSVVYAANKEQLHSTLKDELSSSWSGVSTRLAMANLSLEEVGHIRSVHAKADIEALPDEGSTKKNVLQGKICFQCVKTRFGLFCRSIKCPLCCQAICSKCVAKVSATPSISLPMADTCEMKHSSPILRKRSLTDASSLPLADDQYRFTRSGSLKGVGWSKSMNQGSILTVCLDCKEMVVNIIRSGETAKKMEAARSMMLASLEKERGIGQA